MMTTQDVLESWEKWAYSTSLDERNYDLCDALKAIRASVDATETALKQVLSAIQAYLPPDGITKDECLNRVIACVDPWPAPQPAPAAPADAKEAARYRWLTDDHERQATRIVRNAICERLPVMSYSTASAAIDAAIAADKQEQS